MSLAIARVRTRFRVGRRMEAPSRLADWSTPARLAGECARQLDPVWPARPGVHRVRRVHVHLAVSPAELTAEGLARAWASSLGRQLLSALAWPGSAGPVEVVHAENRAAWLAAVISDILAGVAGQRWEYEEFEDLLRLGTTDAILALLCREPAEIVPALLSMEARGTLDRLLSGLDDLALERLFVAIAEARGIHEVRLGVTDLLTVGRLALARGALPRRTGFASREHALRVFLAIVTEPGLPASHAWSPREVYHALTTLALLVAVIHDGEPDGRTPDVSPPESAARRPDRLPRADVLALLREVISGEELDVSARELSPETLTRRLESPPDPALLARLREAIGDGKHEASAPGPTRESLEPRTDSSVRSLKGPPHPAVLTLLRELIGRAEPAARGFELTPDLLAQRLKDPARPAVPALVREAGDLARRHALLELRRMLDTLRPLVPLSGRDRGADTRLRRVSSDCAGLFLLVRLLACLRWPERILASSLGQASGPRAITYCLAGLGLAGLGRFVEAPDRLDPGLALFAGWLDEPDLAGVRRFFAAGSPAERQELLVALLGAGETVDGRSDCWASTFDRLADHIIRSFAWEVRGFRQSSREFVVKRFLALPGRIEVGERWLSVTLASSPFHPALHLSGMDEAVEAAGWLGGRRVELQLDGL